MARPIRVTVGAQTVSDPLPMNLHATPFNIGLGIAVSGGASLTYKVQHTFDDVFAAGFVAASATWFDHSTITGKTASFDGNYAYPVVAIRLNVTVWASGTATLTVLQAGIT